MHSVVFKLVCQTVVSLIKHYVRFVKPRLLIIEKSAKNC